MCGGAASHVRPQGIEALSRGPCLKRFYASSWAMNLSDLTQSIGQVKTATSSPKAPEPSQVYDLLISVEFLLAALFLSTFASVIATVFRSSY